MTKLSRMDLEDKFLAKASGVRSLSSSVHSTPEKNGHSDDASRSPELPLAFVKYAPRKELLQTCSNREKRQSASSKSKMTEHPNTGNRLSKKQEQKRTASSHCNKSTSKKQPRKGENPTRFSRPDDLSDLGCMTSWVCKNAACGASLSSDKMFCKRCSCCICHLFDENKDPSLWLECASEFGVGYSCGSSCHIECSLKTKKVGVVNLGQLMQLDGSYCCTCCGKVSGILGSWKKQMAAAKDARRVDILCYRLSLSYRLLDGTSRFKEIHEIAKEAKEKLETEVGPLNEVSLTMHRGIVSRLSVAVDVQNLCSLAIEKSDDVLVMLTKQENVYQGNSLPAACKFIFQEVTCSSVVIVLVELSDTSSENSNGYKLRYFKSRAEKEACKPVTILPRNREKILVSNLQPCTEYTFEVVSYNGADGLGHSLAKCFTKSIDIVHKNIIAAVGPHGYKISSNGKQSHQNIKFEPANGISLPKFDVQDLGKGLQQAQAQEQGCLDDSSVAEVDKRSEASTQMNLAWKEQFPCSSHGYIDLNVVSVPDLNEEVITPFEDIDCVFSHDVEKDCLMRSQVSRDTLIWVHGQSVESNPVASQKRHASSNEEANDSGSALIDNSLSGASNGSGGLEENFESCVKMIRWLECEGHINKEFRLKLLTWYSMRSTEQERRVVGTFVQTLIDDPSCLAAQLIHSFSDIISCKKP